MNTIWMNSESSRTSDPKRLFLSLQGKINLKKVCRFIKS